MNEPRDLFFYSASAMALGGRITRPFDGVIESQAASVLPIVGGMGIARVENFRFREIVSFKTGYSLVTGSQSRDRSFETGATAAVEDLNILHMVTATRVVSHLASNAPFQEQQPNIPAAYFDDTQRTKPDVNPPAQSQPTIITDGSQLTGLNVIGCELDVELDTQAFKGLNKPEAYRAARGRKGAVLSNGMVITSLVKEIKRVKGSCSGITISDDHSLIEVPHFGRIHVAQFLLTPFSWRLVMLRVELGCPTAGAVAAGCTQGNGLPPPH